MFFVLSKLLDILVAPLTWALALAALALLLRRRRRLPVVLGIAALAVIYFFSVEPVANRLWRSLETPPSTTFHAGGEPYDAVIVLSGLLDEGATEAFGVPSYNDNIERLLTAFDLLRKGEARRVLLSGGSGRLGGGLPESDFLAAQLVAWGIDEQRIVVESGSRNTHENAERSSELVRARGWRRVLLVTSAFHMRRALGCFARAGLPVDALAVDFRSYDSSKHWGSWLPRAGSLATSTAALHERVGQVVYRLRGYSR